MVTEPLQKIIYNGSRITYYWDALGGKTPKEGFEKIKEFFWGQSFEYKEGKL